MGRYHRDGLVGSGDESASTDLYLCSPQNESLHRMMIGCEDFALTKLKKSYFRLKKLFKKRTTQSEFDNSTPKLYFSRAGRSRDRPTRLPTRVNGFSVGISGYLRHTVNGCCGQGQVSREQNRISRLYSNLTDGEA